MNPLSTLTCAGPFLAASCLCIASSSALALSGGDGALDLPTTSPVDSSSAEPSLASALPIVPALLLVIETGPTMLGTSFSPQGHDERRPSIVRTLLTDTLSAALPGRRTEIAMPFAAIDYRSPEDHDHGYSYGHDGDYSLRRMDLQLRRFARDGRQGMYAGTLMRASWMDGEAYEPFTSDHVVRGDAEPDEDRDDALSRIGAGVVIGVRGDLRIAALPGRLYWGANLHLGRWLGGSPTRLAAELDPLEDTGRYFADIELAKVGMRF